MKKTTKHVVNAQVPKGCVKISSFFGKQTENSQRKTVINDAVTLKSDDDDDLSDTNIVSPTRKRKLIKDKSILSPDLKKRNFGDKTMEKTNGEPSGNTQVSPILVSKNKTSKKHQNRTKINDNEQTPVKKSQKGVISIKSAEKLLTPEAFKEYSTPEKIMERFLEKNQSPTTRKLNFDCGPSKRSVTPKKQTPNKGDTPNKMRNTSGKNKEEITPNKRKNTPKKLFERSPSNLSEFKVNVLDDFVSVTPSKSNKIVLKKEERKSSEKKQTSILKYASSGSSKCLEVQKQNEKTPVKQQSPVKFSPSPNVSRVKTKLLFSNEIHPEKSPKTNRETTKNSPIDFENDINFSNVDFTFEDSWEEQVKGINYTLDLSRSQHCEILDVNNLKTHVVLVLKCTKSDEQAICNLNGFWAHTKLNIGDTIHISANKNKNNEWIIDNNNGLLVYEPDMLISTTTVVNSVFCKRRSVLSEIFKGFEPPNKHMIIGTLVHDLLENVLKKQYKTYEDIEKEADDLIRMNKTVRRIYECGISVDEVRNELKPFVSKIVEFTQRYICDNKSSNNFNPDDWKGRIKEIDDIEENIWCPDLGIKGKIDVSIKTDFHTMPLELKTGRATVSLEHRGQVILYIMMMNKLGYQVGSGLLLYLREGVLKEIKTTPVEKRDIMILRNELTYYLTQKPKIIKNETEKKYIYPMEIPEPIGHHSACYKCPYNVICTSYAKVTGEDISMHKPLQNIQNDALLHLKSSHLEYFTKWISLLALESDANVGQKDLREIYTLTPKEREMKGRCVINLKVTHIDPECNGIYNHTFESIDCGSNNFLASGLMEGNYVVVSMDTRPAVAAGFIVDIQLQSIVIALDRNLNKKYSNKTFHIDSYDSNSIQSYNSASLTLLLELSPRAEQLRNIIIDKQLPTFQTKLPKAVAVKGKPILTRLNKVQQRAVLRAIAAQDYFLIKGMPGTGKTSTIVALIQLLVELGKSVIITSHTHSAVDNVCLKLRQFGIDFMRLGNESKIHENLKEFSEYKLTENCNTPQQLEEVYNRAQVLAVTCLGSGHPVLSKRTLDVCIVDESTQVLQSSVIRPLYAAKTFILIGDPDQLPAVVKNKDAIELGMSESIFERLSNAESTIALNLNYRMNEPITALANVLTYHGELLIGSEKVAKATLNLPKKQFLSSYKHHPWICEALDCSLENSIKFVDTGPVWNLQHTVSWATQIYNENGELNGCVNIYEAAVAFQLVNALLKVGVTANHIGVIATYRAQVAQISALLAPTNVEVSTVDRFQGKDRSVIIYSCSKSKDISKGNFDNKFELLEDKRRLNVAITRAKHKLIVVGDLSTLRLYSTFDKMMMIIEKNLIKLTANEWFQWESVLNIT